MVYTKWYKLGVMQGMRNVYKSCSVKFRAFTHEAGYTIIAQKVRHYDIYQNSYTYSITISISYTIWRITTN